MSSDQCAVADKVKTIRVVAAVIRKGDKIFSTARGYGEYKGWQEVVLMRLDMER